MNLRRMVTLPTEDCVYGTNEDGIKILRGGNFETIVRWAAFLAPDEKYVKYFLYTFQEEDQVKIFNIFKKYTTYYDERSELTAKELREKIHSFVSNFLTIVTPSLKLLSKLLDFTAKYYDDLMREIHPHQTIQDTLNQINLRYLKERMKEKPLETSLYFRSFRHLIKPSYLRSHHRSRSQSDHPHQDQQAGNTNSSGGNTNSSSNNDLSDEAVISNPNAFAETLTSIETTMFMKITAMELLQHHKPGMSPQLSQLAAHYNNMGKWVATMVLSADHDLPKQIEITKKFIQISYRLLKLNNINGATEIYCGLTHIAIQRLSPLWRAIKAKGEISDLLVELEEISSPMRNFKKYREVLSSIVTSHTVIPYIATHLKDLTFARDGNPDLIPVHKISSSSSTPALSSMTATPPTPTKVMSASGSQVQELLLSPRIGGYVTSSSLSQLKDYSSSSSFDDDDEKNGSGNTKLGDGNEVELIDDDDDDDEKRPKVINFEKKCLIGSIIHQILSNKKQPIAFEHVDEQIKRYLRSIWWLEDEDLMSYSYSIVPKSKKTKPKLNKQKYNLYFNINPEDAIVEAMEETSNPSSSSSPSPMGGSGVSGGIGENSPSGANKKISAMNRIKSISSYYLSQSLKDPRSNDLPQLVKDFIFLKSCIHIRDRIWKGEKYVKCFSAVEMIEIMLDYQIVNQRKEAVEIGQQFLQSKFIVQVSPPPVSFVDKFPSFYVFTDIYYSEDVRQFDMKANASKPPLDLQKIAMEKSDGGSNNNNNGSGTQISVEFIQSLQSHFKETVNVICSVELVDYVKSYFNFDCKVDDNNSSNKKDNDNNNEGDNSNNNNGASIPQSSSGNNIVDLSKMFILEEERDDDVDNSEYKQSIEYCKVLFNSGIIFSNIFENFIRSSHHYYFLYSPNIHKSCSNSNTPVENRAKERMDLYYSVSLLSHFLNPVHGLKFENDSSCFGNNSVNQKFYYTTFTGHEIYVCATNFLSKLDLYSYNNDGSVADNASNKEIITEMLDNLIEMNFIAPLKTAPRSSNFSSKNGFKLNQSYFFPFLYKKNSSKTRKVKVKSLSIKPTHESLPCSSVHVDEATPCNNNNNNNNNLGPSKVSFPSEDLLKPQPPPRRLAPDRKPHPKAKAHGLTHYDSLRIYKSSSDGVLSTQQIQPPANSNTFPQSGVPSGGNMSVSFVDFDDFNAENF